jgi:glycosyltransferase involved in cell wall biosynthesis
MSVLEALAAGLPVVAGRTSGGTPWVLGHGGWGVLADVSSPGPLADAIERLLTDRTLATTLAERGRQAAERLFSGQAVVAGYRAEYERVLARSTRFRAQLAGRGA